MTSRPGCLSVSQVEEIACGATLTGEQAAHLKGCLSCQAALTAAREDAELAREVAAATKGSSCSYLHGTVPGYDVLEEVHRGGQGVVYRARHCETKRIVAIKFPLAGAFQSPAQRRRFEREIELVAQLRHPNIVTLYDSGRTTTGVRGYSMEYVEGLPLDRFVHSALLGGRSTPGNRAEIAAIARLFATIAGAVAYAHQHGVLHRDLKPGNILVDAQGSPHVLDFGLGRLAHRDAHSVTLDGEFTGTLDYAAPEQVSGVPDAVDLRADIYALGVMLYELLTGCRPRNRQGPLLEQIRQVSDGVVKPPAQRNRIVDSGIDAIVMRCLRKSPEERYASAAALQADLNNYLEGRPLEARSESRWYRVAVIARRHRWLIAAASSVFLLALATAISMALLYHEAERARARSETALASAQLEQARLSMATGRVSSAEDSLWAALLRSNAPLGVENTDPIFWALLELYAHHPCRRTWPAPAGELLRAMEFDGENSLMTIFRGGAFWRMALDSGTREAVWDAQLPGLSVFLETSCRGVFLGSDLRNMWLVEPEAKRLGTAMPLSLQSPLAADFGVVAGVCDDAVCVRRMSADKDSGREICIHASPIRYLALGDERLISADESGVLACTDISSDPPALVWERHDLDPGTGFCTSAAAGIVAYQQRFSLRVAFVDFFTGALLSVSNRERASRIFGATIDASGEHAFISHLNETAVTQYRIVDGAVVRDLLGHRERVCMLRSSPDGRYIASGTVSGEIKIWDGPGHSDGAHISIFRDSVLSLCFDPQGVRLLVAAHRGAAGDQTSELPVMQALPGLDVVSVAARTATWSADARCVVAGSGNTLRVWDAKTGRLTREAILPAGLQDLCVLEHTNWVAAACQDGVPRLYNVESGEVRLLPGQGKRIASIAASPDGRWVAYCGEAKRVSVADAATGSLIFDSAEAQDLLRSLAFSADGSMLAVAGNDSIARLYRTSDWRPVMQIEVRQQPIFGLAFRPDGKVLATGEAGGTIMLWDVATGKNLLKLARHSAPVFALAYSPDGRILASGGQDRSLVLHDVGFYEAHVAGNFEAALARDASVATSRRAAQVRAWAGKVLRSLRE